MNRLTTLRGHALGEHPAVGNAPLTGALTFGIVAGTLGLVIGASLLAASSLPALALLVPGALVAAAFLALGLIRPGLALGLLPLIAATVPLSVGTGTGSRIVAALAVAAFLIVAVVARALLRHDLRMASSPVLAPTVALALAWVMAFLYSDAVHSPLVWTWDISLLPRIGQLAVVLISAGTLVMALNLGRDLRWVKVATWSLILLSLPAFAADVFRIKQLDAVISSGGLFTMWVVALACGQALYNTSLPRWTRLALGGLTAAWMYKAFIMQAAWFSGWMPAVVAIAVIIFFRSRWAFLVLTLMALAYAATHYDQLYAILWQSQVDEGDLSRLSIWSQAGDLIRRYPLLGTGPAGYAAYYMTLYLGSSFSMSSHSNYVDVVLQTGIIGTVVFAWFLISLLLVGWRARRTWRSDFGGGFAQGAFGGLVGVIVAMALGDWFIPFVYNQTIAGFRYTVHSWVFLGFLASLAASHPTSEEP